MKDRLNDCLKNEFENEYLLPFLHTHGEGREILERELDAIRTCGIREVCLESRNYEEFCGEQWWKDVKFILDYAEKHGMKLWILDDKHFPTGYANGYIKEHPELNQVTLTAVYRDILGGRGPVNLQTPDLNDGESFALVVAFEHKEKSGEEILLANEPIVLNDAVHGGFVTTELPVGVWRVFYLIRSQTRHHSGNYLKYYIDMLNPESTKAMLHAVYEPHYEHFKDYFGGALKGFFSDEPCFGNQFVKYLGHLGVMTTIPWRDDLPELMSEKCGISPDMIYRLLPALFQNVAEYTPQIRFAYMDTVTELYTRNFSYMLGDWCRERGVMYIGHIIEDSGAHLGLGYSAGHYFRALDGQDMAGVDIVLNQFIPGILENTHSATIWEDCADPKIFNYLLGKLGSSHAHIDEKKKGRAMCEMFGAFGWAEGLPVMKRIADHFLCCGTNYFVPHAFSLRKDDTQHPPYFYNYGRNTQFELFKGFMTYLKRVSHLLSSGVHKADVAVLYNTGIWTSLEAMPTEEVTKLLTQNQIDFDIIPEDYIIEKCSAEGGVMRCGRETYGAIVVPYCEMMPKDLRTKLDELAFAGVPVCFVGGEPEMLTELSVAFESKGRCFTAQLDRIPNFLRERGLVHLSLSEKYPHVRYYHTVSEDGDVYMFYNEDELVTADFSFNCNGDAVLYDAYENLIYKPQMINGEVRIKLEPSCSILVVSGMDFPDAPDYEYSDRGEWIAVDTEYSISTCRLEEQNYKPYEKTRELRPIDLDKAPGTAIVRYDFTLDGISDKSVFVDLGNVGETAELWINGEYIGAKISSLYRFDISGKLNRSENEVTVRVIINQAYNLRSYLSEHLPIPLPGICGEIKLRSY